MYENTNPAVIKSILSRMSAKELKREMEFMRSELEGIAPGNRRNMFLRLYVYARNRLEAETQFDGLLTLFSFDE